MSGRVFNDLNGDGRYEDGEPLLSGVTVTVAGPGTGFQAVTTGIDGVWAAPKLYPGLYAVTNGADQKVWHLRPGSAPAAVAAIAVAGGFVDVAVAAGATLQHLDLPVWQRTEAPTLQPSHTRRVLRSACSACFSAVAKASANARRHWRSSL